MKGNIVYFVLCVFIFNLLCGTCYELKPKIEYEEDLSGPRPRNVFRRTQVSSIIYKTVNKYYCSLDAIVEGSHLIVYGTRRWTFPVQDVNLTLSYPSVDKLNIEEIYNEGDYLITGFKVVLYIDGPGSKGFITDGGVLRDKISLSFVSSQISELRYEFWLYGARKDTSSIVELNTQYRLCV